MGDGMPAFGLRFAAEMDARPRIQADLAFWTAHSNNADAETEAALILRLSDEYLTELEQATPFAAFKTRLQDELARRQACWFGAHGRLYRIASRLRAGFAWLLWRTVHALALRPFLRSRLIHSDGIQPGIALDAGADGLSGPDHGITVRAKALCAKMGRRHRDEQTACNDKGDEQNTHNPSP